MIVTVGSWRGTGATTVGLLSALSAASTGPAWFIEADPAGGTLAGRMVLDGGVVGGLERVAFGPGASSALETFEPVALRMGELRVVTAPADPFRAHSCHTPRVQWAQLLDELPGVVVVDVGRLRAGSPALALVRRSARVLLVTVPEVSALVASAEWLASAGRVSPGDAEVSEPDLRMVVVDAPGGVGFSRPTLERELAEHWGGWVPWEPGTVDLVHRGAGPDDRRLRRSPLMAAVAPLAGLDSCEPLGAPATSEPEVASC